MTMHRLTAGAGYQYLLKHTASGDCGRSAKADLTAYYTSSGNPAGRWYGRGLDAFGADRPSAGSQVSEPQMANLFGQGKDPTAVGVRFANSTRVIVAIAASRASSVRSCGSAATCLAMRSAAGVWCR